MINYQPVKAVQEFKYLGVFFDCTLSFTAKTEYIFQSINQFIYKAPLKTTEVDQSAVHKK